MLDMIINIDPQPKPRMVKSDAWKKRPCVTRYWAYKDELNYRFIGKVGSAYTITFVIPMPKSWPNKKKQEMNDKPHQQKPDIDNLIKAFQDCLCEEDSHIWLVEAKKIWGVNGRIDHRRLD